MAEDNAYEDTTRVEQASKNKGQGEAYGAQELPAKFKSVSALARAYEALQAEFTRRSQKLKELERKAENFEADKQKGGMEEAEKLSLETENAVDEEKPVKENNVPLESASKEQNLGNGDTRYEMKANLAQENVQSEGGEEIRETQPLEEKTEAFERETTVLDEARKGEMASTSAASGGEATELPQSLYERVRNNEEVRLKIIGEYLSSIGKTSAPLMASGAGTLATPPKKAKDIHQAGDMALLYFKRGGVEA